MKKELFICQCHSEGLSVEKIDKDIYLSMWSVNYSSNMTFLQRIKYCFHVLKTGQCYKDQIILDQKTARCFSAKLLKLVQ